MPWWEMLWLLCIPSFALFFPVLSSQLILLCWCFNISNFTVSNEYISVIVFSFTHEIKAYIIFWMILSILPPELLPFWGWLCIIWNSDWSLRLRDAENGPAAENLFSLLSLRSARLALTLPKSLCPTGGNNPMLYCLSLQVDLTGWPLSSCTPSLSCRVQKWGGKAYQMYNHHRWLTSFFSEMHFLFLYYSSRGWTRILLDLYGIVWMTKSLTEIYIWIYSNIHYCKNKASLGRVWGNNT